MSLVNVSDVVDCLNTQPLQAETPAAGGSYDDNGNYVEFGPPVVTDFSGDVQSPSPRELRLVPDSERTEEIRSVFSTTLITTTKEIQQQRAAFIYYQGTKWKIVGVTDWGDNGYYIMVMVNTKVASP